MAINSAFIKTRSPQTKKSGIQSHSIQRGLGAQPNFPRRFRQAGSWMRSSLVLTDCWTRDLGRSRLHAGMSRAATLSLVILCWAAIYLPALGSLEIKGE